MIHGKLDEWRTVAGEENSRMAKAFLALEKLAANPPENGRQEVDGDKVYVSVQRYTPAAVADGKFEAHRKYIDIQFLASGSEQVGVLPLDGLEVVEDYDAEKDCIFYRQPDGNPGLAALNAGEFMVLYPEDAHMPGREPESGNGEVIKFVAKVLAD